MAASSDELLEVLRSQNPWHRTGKVPSALAHPTERSLGRLLWRRLVDDRLHRFHLILGPRRVGKTTALYQTVHHLIEDAGLPPGMLWWLRLDHPALLRVGLGELAELVIARAGATSERPVYLMLDEIVYARDWDLWLKTFFDDGWPVRIAATSSATAALRDRRMESGVGRWDELYLTPYRFDEFLELRGESPPIDATDADRPLAERLKALTSASVPEDLGLAQRRTLFTLVGGFPELLAALASDAGDRDALEDALLRSQQVLRSDAVERAIYKDIPQTFNVREPMELERALYVLAAQFTGVLSPTRLCTELGISQPTLDRFVHYLEQAFLVFVLPNWSGREATVQKRGRKLFFLDGAVRNAALQRGLGPLDDAIEAGKLLENLVAGTLRTLSLHTGDRLFHWRDGNDEVDFVLDRANAPLAVEVGSADSHARAGLIALGRRHARFANDLWLVTPNSPVRQPGDTQAGVGTLPVDLFLLMAAQCAEAALRRRLAGR